MKSYTTARKRGSSLMPTQAHGARVLLLCAGICVIMALTACEFGEEQAGAILEKTGANLTVQFSEEMTVKYNNKYAAIVGQIHTGDGITKHVSGEVRLRIWGYREVDKKTSSISNSFILPQITDNRVEIPLYAVEIHDSGIPNLLNWTGNETFPASHLKLKIFDRSNITYTDMDMDTSGSAMKTFTNNIDNPITFANGWATWTIQD